VGAAVISICLPALALGHAERTSYFPNFDPSTGEFGPVTGSAPKYRKSGGNELVVCKDDSAARIASMPRGAKRLRAEALLPACAYQHIQAAVDAAVSDDRILVLPGTYREEPSNTASPECEGLYQRARDHGVFSYEDHLACPNAANAIAVLGDGPDPDRACDRLCNLQIEGVGGREYVTLEGERAKLNLVRADRADGFVLKGLELVHSDFNNVYVLETNGFRLEDLETHDSREYGALSFASDHGVYNRIEAYRNGDSGVYPGSGPERPGCSPEAADNYGIEIKNVDSHDNTIGYSGTAGNHIYAHDNKFHDNATGITTDSFASNHPGMPQDCARWERNEIYSNNLDLFNDEHDAYCKQAPEDREDPEDHPTCPTFQVPVGTGILIAGGNANIVGDNYIYDNWRWGTAVLWVPAALRGDDDSGQSDNDVFNQYDTSHDNRYVGNRMGVRPDGSPDPNGLDHWWDEEGRGNCWSGNTGPGGSTPTSDPLLLPKCENGGSIFTPGNPVKQASNATCTMWNPRDNTDPPGCSWFTQPPEPESRPVLPLGR